MDQKKRKKQNKEKAQLSRPCWIEDLTQVFIVARRRIEGSRLHVTMLPHYRTVSKEGLKCQLTTHTDMYFVILSVMASFQKICKRKKTKGI